MKRYIQAMVRDEPITFAVMLLMIAILIFGVWSNWPAPKKTAGFQAVALVTGI